MKDEMNRIDMICAEILEKSNSTKPLVGLVLGSGLGQYAEAIENPVAFPYVSLPCLNDRRTCRPTGYRSTVRKNRHCNARTHTYV